MLEEIRALGFEFAELSHGIRISLLPGILDAVDSGIIRISTVHNFCPLPMGIDRAAPNIFQFSSDNPRERENAYRHTVKSIETAARLKARLVVLHMGSVDMKDYTDRLIELIVDGKKDHSKFQKLRDEACRKRQDRKEKYVRESYAMLNRLVPVAENHGVMLGIENREAIEEIPFEEDFSLFFREFNSPAVKYWHDTGHAQIKEHLGFIDHVLHLESLMFELAGFHIHDVEYPGRDHRAPGTGCINFEALKPFVKPDQIKVFEFSPSLDTELVRQGVAHVKALWGNE